MTRKRRSWWGELVPLGKARRRRVKHATFGAGAIARRVARAAQSPLVRFPGTRAGRRYRRTY